MQKPYDVMARGLIEGILSGPCVVRVEEPVVADARSIDALVEPIDARRGELEGRGFVGRLGERRCVIEPFHDPPSPDEADACLLKVIALHQQQLTAWRALDRATRGPAPRRPLLWIVSAGSPDALLSSWALEAMEGWPTGCFANASERAPRVVVVSRLPRTRDTLLARWMGSGDTLSKAVVDLHALPVDAWERRVLAPLLELLRQELPRMGVDVYTPEEDAMRYEEARQIFEAKLEKRHAEGVSEGRTEGRTEGLTPLVRMFERKLGRALTEPERASLSARLDTAGPARLGDVVLDLDSPALDAWLRDPTAT
ncbi:MAG: hypothetical protein Q8S73_02695 [Deltaproteobacteria bacterium]|nr:hypothetical protein [Myxococcales bacterium]MDP3212986.1 hypothetical protein [Deltaproteobacteria bacterium]